VPFLPFDCRLNISFTFAVTAHYWLPPTPTSKATLVFAAAAASGYWP